MIRTFVKRNNALGFTVKRQSIHQGTPFNVQRFRSTVASAESTLDHAVAGDQNVVDAFDNEWAINATGVDEEMLQGKRKISWWTGKAPHECPGLALDDKVYSLAQPRLNHCTKEDTQNYFDNTWTLTEILFSGMQGEEAFYRPPYHHLRHPMIFYYGHPACFYVNKLQVSGILERGINPYFEEIFEVGVDEMRWDDMSKNTMDWPTISDVQSYRREVYTTVSDVISEHLEKPTAVTMEHPLWSLFMGFEHERIHLETSSVLLREMPLKLLRIPEYFPDPYYSQVSENPQQIDFPENALVHHPGGKARIGKKENYPSFGWDNEYGSREIDVPAFNASKFKVSNGEFYEFVVNGGYREEKYWSKEGWAWRKFRNAKWPFFWVQDGPQGSHRYKVRTIFEEVPMPWSNPVVCNFHEAQAFCKWKSEQLKKDGEESYPLRVSTEAEHQLMRDEPYRSPVASPEIDPALNFGGEDMPRSAKLNLNLSFGSEIPVDTFPPNDQGFHDIMGNVWEWTEDHFNPLKGFKVHPYYDDFSSPCFDGEHHMIMGGSFISTGDAGANLHSRYHFRPHFLQHSGFRYVQPTKSETYPAEGVATLLNQNVSQDEEINSYETAAYVDQYMALHYGQYQDKVDRTVRSHDERPDAALLFPQRCAELITDMARKHNAPMGNGTRALDVGCSVGGSSFELTKNYETVVGVDFSNAFIAKADEMKKGLPVEYTIPTEGKVFAGSLTASLDPNVNSEGAHFMVGDACNMPSAAEFGGKFDAVLMANLLCRLPDPAKCLLQMQDLMNEGGILALVSPYSWLDEYTPESKWLGGTPENPDASKVVSDLVTSQGFKLVDERDLPLLIREHERKYQYIVSHATVYQKVN